MLGAYTSRRFRLPARGQEGEGFHAGHDALGSWRACFSPPLLVADTEPDLLRIGRRLYLLWRRGGVPVLVASRPMRPVLAWILPAVLLAATLARAEDPAPRVPSPPSTAGTTATPPLLLKLSL